MPPRLYRHKSRLSTDLWHGDEAASRIPLPRLDHAKARRCGGGAEREREREIKWVVLKHAAAAAYSIDPHAAGVAAAVSLDSANNSVGVASLERRNEGR